MVTACENAGEWVWFSARVCRRFVGSARVAQEAALRTLEVPESGAASSAVGSSSPGLQQTRGASYTALQVVSLSAAVSALEKRLRWSRVGTSAPTEA